MLTWNGDKWLVEMEKKVRRAVEASAIDLQNDVRLLISTPSRKVSAGIYTKGKNKGQTKKVLGARGSNRSRPGEPPHKDTGTLRSSIAHEMQSGTPTALVGSSLKVARWMELGRPGGKIIRPAAGKKALSWVDGAGNRRFAKKITQGAIAPRPFLRPALAAAKQKIHDRINAALHGHDAPPIQ